MMNSSFLQLSELKFIWKFAARDCKGSWWSRVKDLKSTLEGLIKLTIQCRFVFIQITEFMGICYFANINRNSYMCLESGSWIFRVLLMNWDYMAKISSLSITNLICKTTMLPTWIVLMQNPERWVKIGTPNSALFIKISSVCIADLICKTTSHIAKT